MKIKDHLLIGIFAGLIGPSIGMLIFYLINSYQHSFIQFINLTIEGKILSPLLSLFAIINLAIFYLFIYFHHYHSARGVIFSTFIYGILIVVLKFVL